MRAHPFYTSKARSLDVIFKGFVPHACNSGFELRQGINPLAGIAHGRSTWAQVIQRVLLNNETPKQAADWGQRQFEEIRRDNVRLLG
jgi:hypothetical protein